MTKPGPSPEYRDLLKGTITPEQYVSKVKKDVDRRLVEQRRLDPPGQARPTRA